MTVVTKRIGGSVAVVIPKAIAREMGISEGTPLEISSDSGGILMRKKGRRERRSLSRILTQIKPAYYRKRRAEFETERPVGGEIW